jgi:tRNA-2-methylthio-N6-dimethylallyladenosine synthase
MALVWVKKYEGLTCDVLVETYDAVRGVVTGRSSQNKLVHLVGEASLVGKTVPVKVTRAFPAMLRGEIVGSISN